MRIDISAQSGIRFLPFGDNLSFDFVVFAPEVMFDVVEEKVKDAFAEFWEQDDECYADIVEYNLSEYTIVWREIEEDEEEDLDSEKEWEDSLRNVNLKTVTV